MIATSSGFDVAVVGAGASGTLLSASLARSGAPEIRVALVEAGARAARGLAYGTPYGAHLLNVPAGRMSAFADDPGHFLRWVRKRDSSVVETSFVPRPLYGEYLADLLEEEVPARVVRRMAGTAVGLTREGSGWLVHLQDGRHVPARHVVLALGNLAPADPLGLADPPEQYVRDPWAPGAAAGLPPDAPVVLIGTSLTMVDVALALRAEGHRGAMSAVSRHGRLPQPHRPHEALSLDVPPEEFATARGALQWVRRSIGATAADGGDWRSVIDALRPHTSRIWQNWAPRSRAAFLRHVRNLWDVHRHRMAPGVAEELDELIASGVLTIRAGRVRRVVPGPTGLTVSIAGRGSGVVEEVPAARLINCTGPATDYARVDLPLVVQMRRAGWLTPDPLGLGIETDTTGRLLDGQGNVVDGVYTIGPLMRPALWECTAIPEIRAQAVLLARHLSTRMP